MTEMFQSLSVFLLYAVLAAFAQNVIFARSLGLSRLFVLVEDNTVGTMQFGGLLAAVQLLAAPLSWGYANYVVRYIPTFLSGAVRPLAYLTCSIIALGLVAGAVNLVCLLTKNGALRDFLPLLPLAAFNCCVLGTMLITGGQQYTMFQSLGFAFGSAVGYVLALLLVSEAQRKIQNRSMPNAFRGLPATLVYIGILSLAIYSATGHMLSR